MECYQAAYNAHATHGRVLIRIHHSGYETRDRWVYSYVMNLIKFFTVKGFSPFCVFNPTFTVCVTLHPIPLEGVLCKKYVGELMYTEVVT